MTSKTFELRDVATTIPVLAIRLDPACDADFHVLASAGFAPDPGTYLLLVHLESMRVQYAPENWGNNRTMHVAHRYLLDAFDRLMPGAVVDVQWILGETETAKRSELQPA